MRVLGVETSCDESAIAIYDSDQGLIAHEIFSQIDLHAKYGGVVPELASRDHIRKTLPLIDEALKKTASAGHDLSGIAYTKGPGLIGALLVGATIARSLAFAWQIPAIGVHHMEAHLMATMLEDNPPSYPFLALIVSGGHTLLVEVREFGCYQVLGQSLDDAVGEAFDKTAKLLGLGYPGGPALEKLAQKARAHTLKLPRPMTNRPGLDFSFSGLKTAVVNLVKQTDQSVDKAEVAAAFQEAVIDTLKIKCTRALEQTGLTTLVVAGGVSANQKLRDVFSQTFTQAGVQVHYPRHEFCTDNGAMVAYTGYLRLLRGERESLSIVVNPRWPL